MKIHKILTFSLLISVFFILCINVTNFNNPQNSTKDNLECQLQNDCIPEELNNKELNIDPPKSSAPLNSKDTYAIVVGISDYPGTGSDLSYCDDDAQDIYSMLINDFNFINSNLSFASSPK